MVSMGWGCFPVSIPGGGEVGFFLQGGLQLSGFGGWSTVGRWLRGCGLSVFLLVGCRVVAIRRVLFTHISLMFIRIHSFESANLELAIQVWVSFRFRNQLQARFHFLSFGGRGSLEGWFGFFIPLGVRVGGTFVVWIWGLDFAHSGLWGGAWVIGIWGVVRERWRFGDLLNRVKNHSIVFFSITEVFLQIHFRF